MSERPILFNGEMVRAILAGRKTQTRRVLKFQPTKYWAGWGARPIEVSPGVFDFEPEYLNLCPYGKPGDRLWVRETAFIAPKRFSDTGNVRDEEGLPRAVSWCASLDSDGEECARSYGIKKTPSIHMPRWASRITLEITTVRVDRLKNITETSARAEGFSGFDPEPVSEGGTIHCWKGVSSAPCPRAHFAHVWESLYGAGTWDSNPWVWVIEFGKVEL